MLSVQKESRLAMLALVFLTQGLLGIAPGQAQLRNIKVADEMPEFSLSDPNGIVFAYKRDYQKVLALVFLPVLQERLEPVVADIETIVKDLWEKGEPFFFVGVLSGSASMDLHKWRKPDSEPAFRILLDDQYKLWGRLGVIAVPTVLIVGKDGRVLWTKAGYGYDFVPAVQSHLSRALGIIQEGTPEESIHVKTLDNTTIRARARRHLQMAKMLEQKGRLESAIAEVRRAAELDPNSVEAPLELGELLCKAGKSKDALEITETLRATTRLYKARLLLISGWARRQLGDLETAQKDLLEATRLNAKSGRGFFELGQVYRAKGDKDKAIAAYHQALTLVFGKS